MQKRAALEELYNPHLTKRILPLSGLFFTDISWKYKPAVTFVGLASNHPYWTTELHHS